MSTKMPKTVYNYESFNLAIEILIFSATAIFTAFS